MSATIDGASWSSQALTSTATGGANGTFSLVGGASLINQPSITIVLYNIAEPGTYPLGVTATVRGGIANVTFGVDAWTTALTGSSGTVTVGSVSATRIAGTFSFTAVPLIQTTTGTRTVTNGTFDMALTAPAGAVPAHVGSSFGGMLNGSSWNAATVVTVSHPSSGVLTVGASNDAYNFNMIISEFTGNGVYALNTSVSRQVTGTQLGTVFSWGGAAGQSTGTVTVTNYTATRVIGSYNVLLQPNGGAAGTLSLSGNFSVGLPQ
jgi:hypothetical protein